MHLDQYGRRLLLRAYVVLGLVVCLTLGPPVVAGDGFVSGVEDLPLAPGLAEDLRAGFSFDSAAGRIVDAYARGGMSEKVVLEFYEETLPQLGWTAAGAGRYLRNGERLSLDVQRGAQGLIVHFSLSPQ